MYVCGPFQVVSTKQCVTGNSFDLHITLQPIVYDESYSCNSGIKNISCVCVLLVTYDKVGIIHYISLF